MLTLLAMEMLGMDDLEAVPVGYEEMDDEALNIKFRKLCHDIVMKVWAAVPQQEVDAVPSVPAQYPKPFSEFMLGLPYAYCICKDGSYLIFQYTFPYNQVNLLGCVYILYIYIYIYIYNMVPKLQQCIIYMHTQLLPGSPLIGTEWLTSWWLQMP